MSRRICSINVIENRGKQAIALRIETCADQFANRAEPFEVAAGIEEKDPAIAWTTRKTHVPPDYNDFGSCEFRMWAAVVTQALRRPMPDADRQHGQL